jgi:L-rhamnose mutarotase
MERVAVFFKLKNGRAAGYKKRHDDIWPEMRETLTKAGIKNYSIWRYEDMLFAYYETENDEATKGILNNEGVYKKWRLEMEEYIYKDANGRKEWNMERMFFHEQ